MTFSLVSAAAARPRWLACWSALLGLPALLSGLVMDDYFIASRLREPDGSVRWSGLFDAFSLVPRGGLVAMRELGEMPWWSSPNLTLDFLRPLSALSFSLDLALFARAPWLMHLESLLLLAALNLVVVAWYARLFPDRPRVFGLALVLFLVAPGHAFVASWLANRNALLATLFGVLSLLLHDHGRRGAGAFRFYALLTLALSLLSGEIGVCSMALLVAYEVCLARERWRARALALLPALLLTTTWLCLHRLLGYGARDSSLYVDAITNPAAFLRTLAENLLLLSFGQWGLPILALRVMLSDQALRWLLLGSALCLALWTPRLLAVLRADAGARFCGLATLLALIPVASTAAHDRLLILADVTGLALVALTVEFRPALSLDAAEGRLGSAVLRGLMSTRVVISLLLSLAYAHSLWELIRRAEHPFRNIAQMPGVAEQTLVLVNAPCTFFPLLLRRQRAYDQQPVPERLRTLVPGLHALEIERLNTTTLLVRAPDGIFGPLGEYRTKGPEIPAWLSPVHVAQRLNQFSRAVWDYRAGSTLALSDLNIRVLQATADGYPREVEFRFEEPLESARLLFLVWKDDGYERFVLPAPGERVSLAANVE